MKFRSARIRHESLNRGKPREGRRGIAAVEFAMVLPIFFTLIFALIEFGRAMMVISLLNNAARSGAREAILPTATTTSISAAMNQILAKQSIAGFSTDVLVNSQSTSLTSAVSGDLITVRVTVPMTNVTWLPGVRFINGNLQGQYSLPKE